MYTDPDQLASASAALRGCSDQLLTELRILERTVTGEGPWGADEPGSLFGAAYTAVLGHALGVYDSHVEQARDAAEGLSQWAANSARVEQENTDRLVALMSQLGR